jgi:hypothetical protein
MGMVDRRLKSAGIAGILLGTSALTGAQSGDFAQSDKPSEQSKVKSRKPVGLRKKIMGLMPLHEQFPEPQLGDLGGDWPVSTDSSAHQKVIRELFDSGATIVNIHPGQADQARVMNFYGRKVLPILKRTKTDGP